MSGFYFAHACRTEPVLPLPRLRGDGQQWIIEQICRLEFFPDVANQFGTTDRKQFWLHQRCPVQVPGGWGLAEYHSNISVDFIKVLLMDTGEKPQLKLRIERPEAGQTMGKPPKRHRDISLYAQVRPTCAATNRFTAVNQYLKCFAGNRVKAFSLRG